VCLQGFFSLFSFILVIYEEREEKEKETKRKKNPGGTLKLQLQYH
jgi:hypothetical protein